LTPVRYALRGSYCNPDGSCPPGTPRQQADTVRIGLRARFLSPRNRAETLADLSVALGPRVGTDPGALHAVFTPATPVVARPAVLDLCQGKRPAVVYAGADTATAQPEAFLTVSQPVQLPRGHAVYYYELGGSDRRYMSGGYVLLARDQTNHWVVKKQSSLWIN
jgi:hypothetical protein